MRHLLNRIQLLDCLSIQTQSPLKPIRPRTQPTDPVTEKLALFVRYQFMLGPALPIQEVLSDLRIRTKAKEPVTPLSAHAQNPLWFFSRPGLIKLHPRGWSSPWPVRASQNPPQQEEPVACLFLANPSVFPTSAYSSDFTKSCAYLNPTSG